MLEFSKKSYNYIKFSTDGVCLSHSFNDEDKLIGLSLTFLVRTLLAHFVHSCTINQPDGATLLFFYYGSNCAIKYYPRYGVKS